jgi:hypothetical protein
MWPEPSPTVTTLSKPACAHRILQIKHPEEYDTHPHDGTYRRSAANTPPTPPKKEEDDLSDQRGGRRRDNSKPAEEETFGNGVHMYKAIL